MLGADDARAVCDVLGIPHQVINFEREFEEEVVDYFCRDYERGRTPNPCLACNDRVKFKHAAGARHGDGRRLPGDRPLRAHPQRQRRATGCCARVDETKDQSYALFTVGQAELSRLLFPLGEHRKTEVRRLARELGLPVAEKRDSFEICFVPTTTIARSSAGACARSRARSRDTAGRVVGRHDGVGGYTVGQRHGLGVALGERRYVVAIDRAANAITIGGEDDLLCDGLLAEELRWVSGEAPEGRRPVEAQVRYRAPAVPATLSVRGDCASVRFRRAAAGDHAGAGCRLLRWGARSRRRHHREGSAP